MRLFIESIRSETEYTFSNSDSLLKTRLQAGKDLLIEERGRSYPSEMNSEPAFDSLQETVRKNTFAFALLDFNPTSRNRSPESKLP